MPSETQPFNTPMILGPDGEPARVPPSSRCPQCGAGPEKRVTSGMGVLLDVTCSACAFEFEKEPA